MADLRRRDAAAARALEFAILTAARSGEVRGMTWGEVDLDKALWIVPGARMKGGREHRVPLSEPAMAILTGMAAIRCDDFVFPGGRQGKPLSNKALLTMLRRMEQSEATAHGFRSTFRDWASETTQFPSEVVEMALAHAIESKVEAAYRRGDLFQNRRELMEAWSSFTLGGS